MMANQEKVATSDDPEINVSNNESYCILCLKLIPPQNSDDRSPRFKDQTIKHFRSVFKLPEIPFHDELLQISYCSECRDLVRSTVSFYQRMVNYEFRLAAHKESVIQHLKQCTNPSTLCPRPNENVKRMCSLRKLIQEKLGIESEEIELEEITIDDEDDFVLDDLNIPYSPIICEEISDHEESSMNFINPGQNTKEATKNIKDIKFVLPDNIVLRDCSISVRKLSPEDLREYRERTNRNKLRYRACKPRQFLTNFAFKSLPQVSKMVKKTRKIRCSIVDPKTSQRCKQVFMNKEKLQFHVQRFHSKSPVPTTATITKRYTCEHCDYSAKTQFRIKKHTMVVHIGVPATICEFCGASFRTEYLAINHKAKEHGEPYPFKCDDCGKGFAVKELLVHHRYTHTGAWKYKCEVCGKGYPTKTTYLMHKQRYHDGWIYKHTCEVCGKQFHGIGKLNSHMNVHSEDKPYNCKLCDTVFKSTASVKRHMKNVHCEDRSFLCQTCGASFKANQYLLSHMKSHNGTDKKSLNPVICTETNNALATDDSLDISHHSRSEQNQNDSKIQNLSL